jgi:hypothetical protein
MRMAKISLAGFKDPVRRPRYIMWTGVAVLVLAAVMIVALGVTSTRWFCSEGCHKVQDDTILAYEASSHSEISCMACHMPVNANPVIFIIHKAEALGELYLTVRNDYELPLNPHSHVSLTMTSSQCTQCHNLDNRVVTPSPGIRIDHAVHAEVNAACPLCHNRVAHLENFDLTLTDPKTGEPNQKHEDFGSMTACFRCHGLEEGAGAPGTCSACHPSDFNLVPESHAEEGFYPKGHAELAKEMRAETDEAIEEAFHSGEGESEEGSETEGESEEETATGSESEETSFLGTEEAHASGGGEYDPHPKEEVPAILEEQAEHGPDEHTTIGGLLPPVDTIFYCETCHTEQFCMNCHGMEMPHPEEFKEPEDPEDPAGHPVISKQQPEKCEMCHGKNAETAFCDSCHHGTKAGGWEFDTTVPWTEKQHPDAVAAGGVDACTGCHETQFCANCHVKTAVVPESHKQSYWTKPKAPGALTVYGKEPAKASAKHALDAQKSFESCDVCHGPGGIEAKFCKNCHQLEMPHPASFKENHVSGKKTQDQCKNCHLFAEVCSNCHHIDSSLSKPWINVHGSSTNKNGATGCVEKCHVKDDCVKCHTERKVVPASHKDAKFVRDFSDNSAKHVELYQKDGEVCTYCHAGDAADLPNSKFCKGCHKIEMPHPTNDSDPQKFLHKEGFESKELTAAMCENCHQQTFCDECHHEGSVPDKEWVRYHPTVVKKDGADPCFECHDPTYCANCHVNLSARGLD